MGLSFPPKCPQSLTKLNFLRGVIRVMMYNITVINSSVLGFYKQYIQWIRKFVQFVWTASSYDYYYYS